jgi:hypothetical protein
LVNQPVLNFASLPAASGYWLGSWSLPVALAAAAIPLSLRLPRLWAQLAIVQTAWTALVVAAGWQLMLDVEQSHPVRWLGFRNLPLELWWAMVGVAVIVTVPIVIRLLALARITRFHLRRRARISLVVLHLVPMPVLWAIATVRLMESVPIESCIVGAVPVVTAMVVAWFGYPAPLTHAVRSVGVATLVWLTVGAGLSWGVFWCTGRPVPNDRSAAIQWGRDGSFDNIRDWMVPWRAPWLPADDSAAGPRAK